MSQKDSMDNAVEAGVKRNKTQKERSNDMRQEKKVGGTKRALLTSVLALVLSLAMLAGSTFAWFTDTASTGVNRIVSGNLDVGLQYWGVGEDGKKTWLTAENSEELFDKNALWEPGYTQIVYLKVENNGNLALTYAMQITPVHETVGVNVEGEEFKLSDYIKFGWTAFTVDGMEHPLPLTVKRHRPASVTARSWGQPCTVRRLSRWRPMRKSWWRWWLGCLRMWATRPTTAQCSPPSS